MRRAVMLVGMVAVAKSVFGAGVEDAVAPAYTTVSWADPSNPAFATLGHDQFLLSTSSGPQVWDAEGNTFKVATGWPAHHSVQPARAALGDGMLIEGGAHDADDDMPLDSVVWWSHADQVFAGELSLDKGLLVGSVETIDARHALVCMTAGKPSPNMARVLELNARALSWLTDIPDALAATMLEEGIRGQVKGLSGPLQDNKSTEPPPLVYDIGACAWHMNNQPAELADAKDGVVGIRHHRLPDGRLLVSEATWYNAKMQIWQTLKAPYLWDVAAHRWAPITNTIAEGDAPFWTRGLDVADPVVTSGEGEASYLEFLDPETLTWRRSTQRLPRVHSVAPVAMTNGDAVVFLGGSEQILRMTPLRQAAPGWLFYPHHAIGTVPLSGGSLLLTGSSLSSSIAQNRPELITLHPRPHSTLLPPMPVALDYLSGVELRDGSVLAFGGLPSDCHPENGASQPCVGSETKSMAYRYRLRTNQWTAVPELTLQYANGPSGVTRNNMSPRCDYVRRGNGDMAYVAGEGKRKDEMLIPLQSAVYDWHPGEKPRRLPAPAVPRYEACLIELRDGRLALIGGLDLHPSDATAAQDDDALKKTAETETWRDGNKQWRPGPRANFPGGLAVRLGNGRIFKLSPLDQGSAPSKPLTAEIADAGLSHWTTLPKFPLLDFALGNVSVIGSRVLLLPQQADQDTVVWDDQRLAWRVWRPWFKGTPETVSAVDARHVLIRYESTFSIQTLPEK